MRHCGDRAEFVPLLLLAYSMSLQEPLKPFLAAWYDPVWFIGIPRCRMKSVCQQHRSTSYPEPMALSCRAALATVWASDFVFRSNSVFSSVSSWII